MRNISRAYLLDLARRKLKRERARQKDLRTKLEGAVVTLSDRIYHLEEREERSMLKARAEALEYFNNRIEEIIENSI
tara:strand:- start:1329 stop:1559 length:231 start_codon:yes stop_codon:yes gene_type:complete